MSAKPPRETDDVMAAAARMIRAVGRRVSTEDPDGMRYLKHLADELDDAMRQAVDGLRRTGFHDGDIGRELGITKQAVAKRWPRRPTLAPAPAGATTTPQEG